jgi:hypothetical protein
MEWMEIIAELHEDAMEERKLMNCKQLMVLVPSYSSSLIHLLYTLHTLQFSTHRHKFTSISFLQVFILC